MPPPAFLPIALGVGILAIVTMSASAKKKPAPQGPGGGPPVPPGIPGFPGGIPGIPGGLPGIPGGIPGIPGSCALDAHMPESHKQVTQGLLVNPSVPASSLVAAAQMAEANGYPMAGQCLRQEAARRGGSQTPPAGFDPTNPATWGSAFPGGLPGMPDLPDFPGQPQAPSPQPPTPQQPTPQPPSGGGAPGWWPPGVPYPGAPGGQVPGFPGNIPGMPGGVDPGGSPGPGAPGGQGSGIGPMPFTIRSNDLPYALALYYTANGSRFHEIEPINPHLGPYTGNDSAPYMLWEPGVTIMLPEQWDPWNKAHPPSL